ncbi:K+/H+ antiporter [Fulvitalea axinellae]|uniref:K+/H+ antiporter n=1 Tax=Fulvitalea axinellae TaxID=1182444 RepID=A0AAU9CNS5_9BACT|nr:K+/H+ antiporter [Fulvitalea axinellae]
MSTEIYTLNNVLLIGSLMLFFSILISKPSINYGIPALIVFLGVGMMFGNGGKYDFYFDSPKISEAIGNFSLAFILFAGGLDTKWIYIRSVLKEGLTLATLGVLLTVVVGGFCIHFITGFDLLRSFLLGAVVSSTDAAAVFSIMKTKKLILKEGITRTLELESGANDPMAYFLTAGITSIILQNEASPNFLELIPSFFLQMTLGSLMGYFMGKASLWVLNNVSLDIKGLYPVLIISLITATFSITALIGGSSFLAVYIMGIMLGNHDFEEKSDNIHFFEGVSWLMQAIMFLILGLQVFPDQMIKVTGPGLLTALALIFIARPVSVIISLLFFKASWRKMLFVSWVGLKGATPIIFAIYPAIHGIEDSENLFNIVFFVVITSVLLQGSTIDAVAHWLNLVKTEDTKKDKPK